MYKEPGDLSTTMLGPCVLFYHIYDMLTSGPQLHQFSSDRIKKLWTFEFNESYSLSPWGQDQVQVRICISIQTFWVFALEITKVHVLLLDIWFVFVVIKCTYLNCIWIKNCNVKCIQNLEKQYIWFGQVVLDKKMCFWTQP